MKIYILIALFNGLCFSKAVLEPEKQIQNSIFYDILEEYSYHRISENNISFDRNSFNLKNIGSGRISINHEWPSDYLIYFLNSESVIAKSRYKNSKKIINELKSDKKSIIEIASTIVHEATHEIELQTTGTTNEVGPKNAEKKFIDWVEKNWKMIITRIPELNSIKD